MIEAKPKFLPNEKQLECINALTGPVMVLAGPGTGKTFTIIQRIKHMLKKDINPSSILCLTYSEAAANEMKKRIVDEIGTVAATVSVNTYHSFCNEIIKQYPNEFELLDGVGLADEITKRTIMGEVLDEFKPQSYRTKWGDYYYYIPELLNAVDEIKSNQVNKEEYFNTLNTHPDWQGKMDMLQAEYEDREKNGKLVKTFLNSYESHIKKMGKAKEAWEIYEKYDIHLKKNNFIDFNDMINMVLDVFEKNEDFLKKVSAQYKYFLVDEYQDTNYSQNKIVFNLAHGANSSNIFVVGDDDQIIYEFQGAKTDTLEKFLIKYPDTKVICLNENNRSTQNILDFSYSIISQDKKRLEFNKNFQQYNIDKKLTAKRKEIASKNKPIQIHGFGDIRQENNFIINKIQEIIKSNELPLTKEKEPDLSKIAILARENYELDNFASLLEANNIKYQLKEAKSIFDIKSSLVTYFYLKALYNYEYNGDKLFGLLLTEPFNFDNADYTFLLEQNRLTNKDLITNLKNNLETHKWASPLRIKNFMETFDLLSGYKSSLNLKELIVEVINRTGILNYFVENDINKSDNIYALKKIIDEADSYMYLNKGAWLGDFLKHIDTAFESNIPINIDKEDYTQNAVQLLTLHGSKGREFEYVFIPNLIAKKWEGKRVNNSSSLPIDKDNKKENEDEAKRSEQLRLLFVGITRAMHSLTLTYSNSIDAKPQELTSYLEEALKNTEITQTFNHDLEKEDYINEIAQSIKKEPFNYAEAFKDEIKARTEKFTLSHSALSSYISCPRMFLYSNIFKIPILDNDVSAAHYGSAIHKTLKYAIQYAKENSRYPEILKVEEAFKKYLSNEKFESQNKRDEIEARGLKCINKYYKQMLETPPSRITETEYYFEYIPVKNNYIKGIIDRIEENSDGTIEVYDYKTGGAKPKTQIADGREYENYLNQLRFYKYALEQKNPNTKVSRAGLIFVEEPDNNFYINLTQEDNDIIEEKIVSTYENISQLNFLPPKKEERNCEYCNYKHICKLCDM